MTVYWNRGQGISPLAYAPSGYRCLSSTEPKCVVRATPALAG